ncbi:TPA: response regulator [Candidatus Poribacteria bacterium]|nr:response regulator [Candidatus Poribacteria bacterium]
MKNKMIKNNRVLIVDDQEEIHKDFEEVLNYPSEKSIPDDLASAFSSDKRDDSFLPKFELLHARSGQEAYNIVKESLEDDNPIAVIYMDVRMPPGWDGIETTRRIREIDKDVEVVIITAYNEKPLSEIVNNIGLLHKLLYIRKPFAREEIQQITISLVEKWNVEKELAEKNRQLEISEQMLRKELKDALAKMLNGFLPICAECKKIRDDNGVWNQIDTYIQKHTGTKFTYSICPECTEKLYPTLYQRRQKMMSKKDNKES